MLNWDAVKFNLEFDELVKLLRESHLDNPVLLPVVVLDCPLLDILPLLITHVWVDFGIGLRSVTTLGTGHEEVGSLGKSLDISIFIVLHFLCSVLTKRHSESLSEVLILVGKLEQGLVLICKTGNLKSSATSESLVALVSLEFERLVSLDNFDGAHLIMLKIVVDVHFVVREVLSFISESIFVVELFKNIIF